MVQEAAVDPSGRLERHSFEAITRQTAAGLAWTGVAMLLGFAVRLILARKMTPHGMGVVLAAQAFVGLALACAELGVPDAVVRYVGRDASAHAAPKDTVRVALRLVGGAGAIVAVASLAALWGWFGTSMTPDAAAATALLILSLPMLAAGDVFGAAFRGINRLSTKLVIADVARPAIVAGILLASPLVLTVRASYVAAVYVAAAVVSAVAFGVLFFRDPRWEARGVGAPDLLRFGIPIAGAAVIAGPLVNSMLPLMLTAGPGPEAVALFTVALSLQSLVYLPIGVFEQAVVPAWSRMSMHEPRPALAASYQRFAHIGFAAAASAGIVIIASDRAILTTLFGPSYAAAAWAVKAAVLATVFGAFTGPNEGMLRALGLSGVIFRSRTIAAVAGVAAGFVLIPRYGLAGAAVAFAMTNVMINGLYAIYLHRDGGIHPLTTRHAVTALLSAAGLGAALQAADGAAPLWIAAHVCAISVLIANADLRLALRTVARR